MTHEESNGPAPKKRRPVVKIFAIILALSFALAIPLLFIKTDLHEVHSHEPLILVSIPPYKKIVQGLVGERFRVESVVPQGFDPHLYEAKPHDMKKLKEAALWFGIGEAFEQRILQALSGAGSKVNYFNLVDELEKKGYADLLIPFDDEHHGCTHDHHDHDSHCQSSNYDRHLWLSLELDSLQAQIIYEKLSEQYPHFKVVFEGYLEELVREHDVLINWIESNLKEFRPISFVTPHPAYSYFAKEFDLTQISIEVAGKEPNIQDLNHLLEELKTTNVDCVIMQPQHSKKAAQKIGNDLDIPIYTIDPYAENYLDTCNRLSLCLANKKKPGKHVRS
ncbi:MAG: metal ABC transporter solute-binding protein, Zn/Mn family [Chlamydiia bacterium]